MKSTEALREAGPFWPLLGPLVCTPTDSVLGGSPLPSPVELLAFVSPFPSFVLPLWGLCCPFGLYGVWGHRGGIAYSP